MDPSPSVENNSSGTLKNNSSIGNNSGRTLENNCSVDNISSDTLENSSGGTLKNERLVLIRQLCQCFSQLLALVWPIWA